MSTPFLLFMPSYNQAHYIAEAVRSVLAQDDAEWELWIVDNSSDNTPQVMRQFTDARIHFQHIPSRMDPGSCLNWMLGRATGRDFSYVHTDNNLHISYVRRMRAALKAHPLALAYCDMRTIDERGRFKNVNRRGAFDLPRLLSLDTLGVPFAATMELAKQVGGFSVGDYADDVCFCVSACGIAHYVYVREPLVDYRLHGGSRTEEAGGDDRIRRLFVELLPKIIPTLEQRGLQPMQKLQYAIREAFEELDTLVEDFWYRKLSKLAKPWWQGYPKAEHFFWQGLLRAPGFSVQEGQLPQQLILRDTSGTICGLPWNSFALSVMFYTRRRQFRSVFKRIKDMLLVWAAATMRAPPSGQISIRVGNLDFRTIWAARQLELSLGWKPVLDTSIVRKFNWPKWDAACGSEPLLDCSGDISLTHMERLANQI